MHLGPLRRLLRGSRLPFDMFDAEVSDAEARRARRMESIYHAGQSRIWDGRDVLAQLIAKHGKPAVPAQRRGALARIFGIHHVGRSLRAWKISARARSNSLPSLWRQNCAAASQVHDEARHFYVMHDYLEALGEKPEPMNFWIQRVLELTLGTRNLTKKLLGMQLGGGDDGADHLPVRPGTRGRTGPHRPIALLRTGQKARHLGLGVQLVPHLMEGLSLVGALDVAQFQLELLATTLISLKSIEGDLLSIGIDPRSMLGLAFRKQSDIDAMIKHEFPLWPEDPPVRRLFEGFAEMLFPSDGKDARVPMASRVRHALQVVARTRPSVGELWGTRGERTPSVHAA